MSRIDGVRLVARRELVERTRDRSFLISTLVTLAILCAFIVVPKLLGSGRTPTYDIGLVGAEWQRLSRALQEQAPLAGVKVKLHRPADLAAAEAALRDEKLDAVIVEGRQVVTKDDPDTELEVLVQSASRVARAQAALAGTDLSPAQIQSVLSPAPLPVRALEPSSPENRAREAIAITADGPEVLTLP